tara:strand:- start:4570 stop:5067 length:498 start_codon:yes stop_codon:yes gene_type:complete
MQRLIQLLGFFLLLFPASILSAAEAEYTTLYFEVDIDKPAQEAWAKVGGYCDIAEWLEVDCVLTSGEGGIGTVRELVGGRVIEIMVALTDLSYGYTQPAVEGEFYNLYHGFMEMKPLTATSSRLLYTLVYDTSNLNQADKEADIARRRAMFDGAVQNIKRIAEAP